MSLHMTKDEIMGTPQRMLDREAEQEMGLTRRLHQMESGERRRQRERDELSERFNIGVVPLIRQDDYAALAAKHLRIGTRRAELDQELQETNTALARGMSAYNKHRIEYQAQAIIDGVEGGDPLHGFEEMKSRSARLENEVHSHSVALRQVWSEMETIRSERSIDAADAARPAHEQVARVIADACATLLKALHEEILIREIVTAAGFDNRLPVFQGIRELSELETRARGYAR